MDEVRAEAAVHSGQAAPRARVSIPRRLPWLLVISVVLLAVAWSVRATDWGSVTLALTAPLAATIVVIDAHDRRIPARLVYAILTLTVAVLSAGAVMSDDLGRLGRAAAAAVVVTAVYGLLWRFASLGLGDVRLAAALAPVAGWDGWPTVLWFIVLAHLLAVPPALWSLARGRRGHLPFGPYLVAGLYAAVALRQLSG